MSELEWPDFGKPVDGISEEEVLRFARAWTKEGLVEISAWDPPHDEAWLRKEGWIQRSRRVLWTLQHIDEIQVDE